MKRGGLPRRLRRLAMTLGSVCALSALFYCLEHYFQYRQDYHMVATFAVIDAKQSTIPAHVIASVIDAKQSTTGGLIQ